MESATEKKKKKQMMSLQSKIEKTDTGEIIYNTKRDWLSNKNKYFQKKKKGEGIGIRMSELTAKSLQLCPTLCNPIDSSPPGFPIPGIFQARTLEWVAISFSNA